VSAATARKQARLTLLELPPIPRLRVPATVQASLAGSRAPPGSPKPEQTLCRLRRRESKPASRSSSFRRSTGSEHQQRCKHRLRGAGLSPATSSRRRCRAPLTLQASPARSRAVPGDRKPEQTPCRLRRRESKPASRSSSFRRSPGSEHQQRCKHRLRGAGLCPATVSRSRRRVGCDGAKGSLRRRDNQFVDPGPPASKCCRR
jgi:hypothetical protein